MKTLRNNRDDRLEFTIRGAKGTEPRRIRLGAKCDAKVPGAYRHEIQVSADDEKALMGLKHFQALLKTAPEASGPHLELR